jgi:hypothetical protein
MNLDYSDGMIFVGSTIMGSTDKNNILFVGGLVASLGINIQFEETRLSITRIVFLSLLGYGLGAYFNKKE